MGISDDVLCNHDIFGEHKGETHQSTSLQPTFPGSTYEITPSGRIELLEVEFEDHSNPDAEGLERFAGCLTPAFTGARRDVDYHGWLDLSCFGRAKFTDGTIVAFEENETESID